MTTNAIDYQNTLFEKAKLTKIIGRPTYATLKLLKQELRAMRQVYHQCLVELQMAILV